MKFKSFLLGVNHMLLSNQGFQASLDKFGYKSHGESVSNVVLNIKHSSEGEIQNFLDDIEKVFNRENVRTLFTPPVQWSKMIVNGGNIGLNVSIIFDEVEFDAILSTITVARKFKQGIESYEYNIAFEKEVDSDNLDKVLITEYLKRKHKNEDDKTVLTMFQVKIRRAEDPKKETILN